MRLLRCLVFAGVPLRAVLCVALLMSALAAAVAEAEPAGSTESAGQPEVQAESQTHLHDAPGTALPTASTVAEWLAATPLGFFSGWGQYMPRTHCLTNDAGQPDWPWIIALVLLNAAIIVGYLRIFRFWRRAYLAEQVGDRNRKMMTLAYIFLYCAICGYGFAMLMYIWPAYRLLAVFLVVLTFVTWRFAWNMDGFEVSLSARRLERELKQAFEQREAQYQTLIACLPDMIFYKDTGGVYLDCNDKYAELLGRPRSEIIGRTDHELWPPELADRFRTTDRQGQREELYSGEDWVPTASGRQIKLHTSKRAFRGADGTLLGVACVARDITAQHHQQVALEQAKAAAESANEAKTSFLANISHEIRTPLTGVLGFAELLLTQAQAPLSERQDWACTIQSSARHLQTLLDDVLDISKIEAGKMDIEQRPVDLPALLDELIAEYRPVAEARGLTLKLHCPRPLPRTIESDPTRLRQVLSNLLTNALKFTRSGGVTLEAETLIETASDPDAPPVNRLRLDVVDTGPGLSRDQQDRLFQRFHQADSSVSRQYGGTGLGLVIARYFCEALGGGLRMESREGFGTRMIVTIDPGPLTPQHCADAAETATRDEEDWSAADPTGDDEVEPDHALRHAPDNVPTAGDQRPKDATILVVDDGATNRKYIRVVLETHGYRVETVEDGQAAVDHWQRGGAMDLVLMDMQMPVLDGYDATRQLRQSGCTCAVVALTASALKGDRQRCFDAGCDDYLTKPIDRAVLLETLASNLGGRATGSTAADRRPPVAALDAAVDN